MIDIENERMMSLAEATKWDGWPRRRNGKRPHIATLWRWAMHGARGVRLETVRCGGTLCTTLPAIARFCEALTRQTGPAQVNPPARISKRRQREIEAAERRCAAAGM